MMNQHLRRMEWSEDEELRFGPFRVIPRERRLEREGKPVRIGGRALDVLLCLLANAPNVVTKATLMDQVWPNLFVDDGNLRFQIFALRRVLADGADGNHYVITVQGRGHAFVARVSRSLGVKRWFEVMLSRGSYGQLSIGKATVSAAAADTPVLPLDGSTRVAAPAAQTDAALAHATLAA